LLPRVENASNIAGVHTLVSNRIGPVGNVVSKGDTEPHLRVFTRIQLGIVSSDLLVTSAPHEGGWNRHIVADAKILEDLEAVFDDLSVVARGPIFAVCGPALFINEYGSGMHKADGRKVIEHGTLFGKHVREVTII
jgi:hypothetical protein